jgi:carboxymethylenebutenolidase
MHEFDADITSKDGVIDTFICHPDEGGPHPAVIFYMDAPAIREELRDMARRLATVGYYVLLPNLYYRVARPQNYGFDHQRIRSDDAERKKMFTMMSTLTNQKIVDDTGPLIAYARADKAAKAGAMGCVGYCMSGRFVMSAGAAYPQDFAAIASYYGVGIITKEADSPHLRAKSIRGEVYLSFAEHDSFVPDAELQQMPGMLRAAGVRGRVEVYPGTEHGFAFPQRASYVKAAGERHWERLFALFERNLKLS